MRDDREWRWASRSPRARDGRRGWRRVLVVCVMGMAVLLTCFVLDKPVHRFVHEHFNENTRPIPTLLKWPHRILRSMENWGENVFILFVLFIMWSWDTQRRSRVVLLVVAAALTSLGVEGLKRLSGRERPDISGGLSVFHGPSKGLAGGDWHSFPSGHTASAAAYSGSIAGFYPPTRGAMIALAVGCGASRIWKERHFLSDCWAGGLGGFLIGFYLPRLAWVRRWTGRMDRFLAPRPCGHPFSTELRALKAKDPKDLPRRTRRAAERVKLD